MRCKIIFMLVLSFIFGLTFDIRYRASYYEFRGFVSVTQRLVDVEFIYTWAAPGFSDKYPPIWDIRKVKE